MTAAVISEVVIQKEIFDHLCKSFQEGRLSTSLLFAGKKGVGKWVVAQALAKTIACLNSDKVFCGECASCKQADQFAHPDIYYLFPMPRDEKEVEKKFFPYLQRKQQAPFSDASEDVKSFITIESIRKFQSQLSRRASLSKNKVGIIYEAERMLPATMDSLLKTLEEPPANSYLIVVTDEPRFLLPTIRSRLQRVNFPTLKDEFIEEYLREHYQVPESELALIARFSSGTLANIESLIGRDFFQARDSALDLFVAALKEASPDFLVKHGDNSSLMTRESVERLLTHWQVFLRDLMVMNAQPRTDFDNLSSTITNFDLADQYLILKDKFASLQPLEAALGKIEQVRNELRRNVNPRMAAFSFLLSLSRR